MSKKHKDDILSPDDVTLFFSPCIPEIMSHFHTPVNTKNPDTCFGNHFLSYFSLCWCRPLPPIRPSTLQPCSQLSYQDRGEQTGLSSRDTHDWWELCCSGGESGSIYTDSTIQPSLSALPAVETAILSQLSALPSSPLTPSPCASSAEV